MQTSSRGALRQRLQYAIGPIMFYVRPEDEEARAILAALAQPPRSPSLPFVHQLLLASLLPAAEHRTS